MIKKLNSIWILALSVSVLAGCDDFLDRNSLVGLSEGSFWKSEQDAVMGVNALYEANREFTNSIVIYGMMDDFTDIAYQSFATGLTTGAFPANAAFYSNSWGIFYKGIYRANTILKNVPGIEMSQSVKDRVLGEARFFRGYYYFKLWDYFGGVPVYDNAMNVDEAYKTRATDREIYEFIVSDMTEAYALLESGYTGANVGRATKWAALSMRGKAHLWAKEYALAAADFKAVMENSGRQLLGNFHNLFRVAGNNNSEVIFDVQYVAEQRYGIATDRNYGNARGATSGSQRTRPTPKLVNTFEMADGSPFDFADFTNAQGQPFNPNSAADWADEASVRRLFENRDPRMHQSVVVPWSTFVGRGGVEYLYRFPVVTDPAAYVPVWTNGSYAWRKFVETGSIYLLQDNVPQNFPLIRLADVMLMYAEAQNEALAAPDQSTYDAINAVRDRADMPFLPTGLTKEEMRERIRRERMVELGGEGQRYSDIRRWQIAKSMVDGVWMTEFTGVQIRQRGFPDHYYLWPIPQSEREVNPLLTQNPGWQ